MPTVVAALIRATSAACPSRHVFSSRATLVSVVSGRDSVVSPGAGTARAGSRILFPKDPPVDTVLTVPVLRVGRQVAAIGYQPEAGRA